MAHYRSLLDPTDYVGPQDVDKADKTVTISRVVREDLPTREGKKPEAAPVIYFIHDGKELAKKLKVPKVLMHGLSLVFGTETDAWVGKQITLFKTRCSSFGEVEECCRIRFDPKIDAKIRKWLKKRRADQATYMTDEPLTNQPQG